MGEETGNSPRDRRDILGTDAKTRQLLFRSCDSASEVRYYPSMSRDYMNSYHVLKLTQ